MIVYLGHPIDHGSLSAQAEHATSMMLARGWVVFDPAQAWRVPVAAEPVHGLQQANMEVLSNSDAMLAILAPDVMTIGTPVEAAVAVSLGKPVAIWKVGAMARESRSWALPGVPIFAEIADTLEFLEGMSR